MAEHWGDIATSSCHKAYVRRETPFEDVICDECGKHPDYLTPNEKGKELLYGKS